MIDSVLYWILWRWIPIRWRIKIENAWYWLIDAHVWTVDERGNYSVMMTARSKIVIFGPGEG